MKYNGRYDGGQANVATHFTVCVGVWVQGEGHRGAQLPGLTGSQLLRHGQDPQTMRKSSFALGTASPSQGRREGHGGGGGRGEQHGATLTLPVTRAVVPVHGDRQMITHLNGIFLECDVHKTQQLHTWGLHSNQGGRTHSEDPECCVCSSTGRCGCDSSLAAGRHGRYTHTAHSHYPPPGLTQSSRDDSAHNEAQSSSLEEKRYKYQGSSFDRSINSYFNVRYEGVTLAFITDPWCSDTGGVEVAATVHITLHPAENQSGWVRRPAEGAFTLKPRAPTALALTALVVAPVRGIKPVVLARLGQQRDSNRTATGQSRTEGAHAQTATLTFGCSAACHLLCIPSHSDTQRKSAC